MNENGWHLVSFSLLIAGLCTVYVILKSVNNGPPTISDVKGPCGCGGHNRYRSSAIPSNGSHYGYSNGRILQSLSNGAE